MGVDKRALPLRGISLLERVLVRVRPLSGRVVTIGGDPILEPLGVPTLPDLYPGAKSMGGIATALAHAAATGGPEAWLLCVACDMPFLEPSLLSYLAELIPGRDVVVPRVELGFEPLCAIYRATCLPGFQREIGAGNLRIFDVYKAVRVREVREEELRRLDPDLRSFFNVNRPADLEKAILLMEG